MTDDLEMFLANQKPRSKLEKHANEIFRLVSRGASMKTIQDYLKQKGIDCSKSSVHRFIHAKKRYKELEQARAGGKLSGVAGGTPVTQESLPPAALEQQEKPTFTTSLPRFDPNGDADQLKAIFGTKKGDTK